MQFRPYCRFRKIRQNAGGVSYYPDQLAKIYGFPAGFDGSGKTVAVIELGGGYTQADLNTYFHARGQSVKPAIFKSVDGAANTPDGPSGADGEVMLDLEVIGGVAPGVQLVIYMAPNSDSGFVNAIKQAVADKVDVISISWGAPENQWSDQARAAMDAAFQAADAAGIAVFVAAGDNGSSDGGRGNNVDYPASSPYVIGCGGTTLTANVSTSAIQSEVVWNDGSQGGATGGGISAVYLQPAYQSKVGTQSSKFRCVPDVAAVADPDTGINILVDGQKMVIGGTSAVAPFWAGMIAVLSQASGKPLSTSAVQALIYGTNGGFRDILGGNNGSFTARQGYDCCTGMGVPIGKQLLAILGNPTAPPPPSEPIPPVPPTPLPSTFTVHVPQQPVYIGNMKIGFVPAYTLTGNIGASAPPATGVSLALPPWLLPVLKIACSMAPGLPSPWNSVAQFVCGLMPADAEQMAAAGQAVPVTLPPWLLTILKSACANSASLPPFVGGLCKLLPQEMQTESWSANSGGLVMNVAPCHCQ